MGTLIAILVAVLGTGMVGLAIREIRTKGAAAAMQLAALGLLLVGSSAVGLVKFVTELVFNPLAWVGVGLLSLAGVLFVVGQRMESPSAKPKKAKEAEGSKEKPAVDEAPKSSRRGKGKEQASEDAGEDFDDIQAILRKHGIE